MKQSRIPVVFAVALLSACGNAQPLNPSAASSSSPAVASALESSRPLDDSKGPNHFDYAPLRGFESRKWHDLTYHSPKYDFGRALVVLPVSEESLQQVASAQSLTYLGNGRVQFADGTIVDAIYGRNTGNPHWQYLVAS